MALRFESAGHEYALRNATVFSHNAAYTMFAWAYLTSDTNDYSHFLHVGDGNAYGGNTDFIGTDSDGTTIRHGCYGGSSDGATTGAAVPVGSWIWVAMVREDAGSLKFYRGTDDTDGSLLSTHVSNTAGRAAAGRIQIGSYNGLGINGRIAYPRIWTRALTLANLNAEAGSAAVVDATNIWSAPPFAGADVAAALLDGSGNGRDFTTGAGTLSLEADPTLGPAIIDLAAAAATVASASADLSVSGVIHKPNNVISGGSGWAVVGGASAAAVLGDVDANSYMRLILDGAEVPLVMDALPTPMPAGTGIRRWHARVNNGLGEVKLTLMDSANTPLGDSGWVAASSTMTAYSSAITISSAATRFKIEGRKTTITGLDFPSNVTGSDTAAPFVAMQFLNPHSNGLPIWGTGSGAARTGATYIWKYRPRQQTGYYVTMWWSNNGSFLWDGGGSNTYYGGHPYPQSATNAGTTHWWELAGTNGGADYTTTLASTTKTVVQDVWYTQALRVIVNGDGTKTVRFYIDLPSTANGDIIQNIATSTWGETDPPSPAVTFGDSPWYASFQHERMSGIFRGLKIFSRTLSEAEMLTEAGADPVVTSGIWYSNINPTPDDITDKSGQGHHFIWADPANKATLWTP